MDPMASHLWWFPAYLTLGTVAYILDLKWGMSVLQFFTRSEEPKGFIVGRTRRTKLIWGLAISWGITLLLFWKNNPGWYMEVALAFVEAIACLIGMELGPLAALMIKGLGVTLDKVDEMQASLKESVPQVIEKTKELAEDVKESLTPAEPTQTTAEERQAKIDKMDQILGDRKSVV